MNKTIKSKSEGYLDCSSISHIYDMETHHLEKNINCSKNHTVIVLTGFENLRWQKNQRGGGIPKWTIWKGA